MKKPLLSIFLLLTCVLTFAQSGVSLIATPTGAYDYARNASNATTLLKTNYGTLRGVTINTSGTASTATLYDSKIIPPVQSAAATSGTGGTLAATTYYYVITSTTATGQSFRSNEVSIVTTGATSSNTINWATVAGATGYNIYRGTSAGLENVFYSVGTVTTFLDIGGANTSASPPTGNPIASINSAATPQTLRYDLAFTNGLILVTTGTTPGDITIVYK